MAISCSRLSCRRAKHHNTCIWYTRLFQPEKPVTKAQAAIALSTVRLPPLLVKNLQELKLKPCQKRLLQFFMVYSIRKGTPARWSTLRLYMAFLLQLRIPGVL